MKLTKTFLISIAVAATALLMVAPAMYSQAGGGARGGSGRGAGPRNPFDFNDNTGYQSLFDGKTLDGWEGAPGMWNIVDGAIHIDTACEHPTGTTYLYWKGGEAADFILKFDMKGTGSVNGGMQIRSFLTEDPKAPKFPPRAAGGGFGGSGRGGAGAPGRSGRGGGLGAGASGRGRGASQVACATPPPPPPGRGALAKWNMNGLQVDFDANNQWPGNLYEQGSSRGTMNGPGNAILAEPGQPIRTVAVLNDRAARDSWFHKDDYNQMMVIAKGNTIQTFMNGHLIVSLVDDDPAYFRPSGLIALEVESTGGYWVKNIYLKKL